MFFMPQDTYPDTSTVAHLVSSNPQQGKAWFEVFIFKQLRIVQVSTVCDADIGMSAKAMVLKAQSHSPMMYDIQLLTACV